jgi:hypothetical protein
MKLLIIYLALQIITCHVCAQLDSASRQWVYQILKQEPESDTITHTDKLHNHGIELIKQSFQYDTIWGWEKGERSKEWLILSKSEKTYVKRSANKMRQLKQDCPLFPGCRMIAEDSMWSYITKRNREFWQFYFRKVKSGDTTDLDKSLDSRVGYCNVFQFSPPIFLRNKTLVIFYYLRMCGSECGLQDLSVYRLENGEYKRWLFVDGGVF